MANKVLSIELGDSLIKICEMDYHVKNPKIYHSFVIPTPQNMIMDGVITKNESFFNIFHKALEENHIKTRKVIFSLSSSKIATREVKIPYCKPNRIADVVRANLLDYFPIDSSKYLISHSILGIGKEKNTEDSTYQPRPTGYRLLVLAAPKPLIDSYYQLAKNLNLEVVAIDYNGNSIYQAVKEECEEGTQLIIKVSEHSSLLLVIKNSIIVLNRTIAYGIDDALETLAETESFGKITNYTQALQIAIKENCFLTEDMSLNMSDEDAWSQKLQDRQKITQSLSSFISGVVRVIDYYNSNHSDEPIEKMLLTGLGADIVGLDKLLTNEVGFQVTMLSKFNTSDNERTGSLNQYISCIGATILPVTFYSDEISENSVHGNFKFDSKKVSTLIFIAGLAIGLIMVVSSTVPYVLQNKHKQEYEEIINKLQPAYDTYTKFQNLSEEVSQLSSLDGETKNRNDELVSFVKTLEEKMPSSFCLNNMAVTKEGITLDVSVGSKEEIASVLSELKSLPLFMSVDTTSIAEISSEIGEKQYSFSVELIYAPVYSQTEDEEN